MKKIEAIVREEKLAPIKQKLEELSYAGMTVSEVAGCGRQKGLKLQWRAGEYRVDLLPKLKIELVVLDEDLSKALSAITASCRSGEVGDGKIFVLPVEDAIRIRTGEMGVNAI